MAVTKTEIFIASRFDEFADLRDSLAQKINQFPVFPLQAVDLNDGLAASSPPLGKCMAAVKRAEVMILLIGETYGGIPAGQELSYTHLEYRAAVAEGSQVVVLPYFISNRNAGNRFNGYSDDAKLSSWQQEIIENHTPAFLDASEDPRILCQIIFEGAYKALYDARTNAVQQKMDMASPSEDLNTEDSSLTVAEDSFGLSHSDMERLDDAFHGESSDLFDSTMNAETPEILLRPAEIAAQEQKREALKAIELGERFIAITHLRKAHEIKPLDFSSTYWLARLLASSGRIDYSRESIRYALLAAKMASYDQRPVKAAASLLIASKAASRIDEHEEALEYAKKAVEETPWLAMAHVGLAACLAASGNGDEALKEVRKAFLRLPQSILLANREPAIAGMGKKYKEFKSQLKESLLRELKIIWAAYSADRTKYPESFTQNRYTTVSVFEKIEAKPLLNLYYEGKEMLKAHMLLLEERASNIINNLAGSQPAETSNAVARLMESILLFENGPLQCQMFSLGRNIRSAKPGDILTVDAVTNSDALTSISTDDAIVPLCIGKYASEFVAKLNPRKRLYRLILSSSGKPVISRWAVYFDSNHDAVKHGRSSVAWDAVQMKYVSSRPSKHKDSPVWKIIREAGGVGTQVNGKIVAKEALGYGYIVDVGGLDAFLPSSQIDSASIGFSATFQVILFDEDNGSIVLSAK